MSQAELARRTGIRPATINEMYWEFAKRVNLEHIDLICKALGCRIEDFMEVVYENNDEKLIECTLEMSTFLQEVK